MADIFQVTVTVPSEEVAGQLGRHAVEQRLAACAQVGGPISSTYWWEGAVEHATEWTIVLKTSTQRLPALVAALRAAHPYDTPEIVATRATGDAAYLAWVEAQTADEPSASSRRGGPLR